MSFYGIKIKLPQPLFVSEPYAVNIKTTEVVTTWVNIKRPESLLRGSTSNDQSRYYVGQHQTTVVTTWSTSNDCRYYVVDIKRLESLLRGVDA
jgi:hypothetical protein